MTNINDLRSLTGMPMLRWVQHWLELKCSKILTDSELVLCFSKYAQQQQLEFETRTKNSILTEETKQ